MARRGVAVALGRADVVAQTRKSSALGRGPPTGIEEACGGSVGAAPGVSGVERKLCARGRPDCLVVPDERYQSREIARVERLTGWSCLPATAAKGSRQQPRSSVAPSRSGPTGSRNAGSPPSASYRASAAARSDSISERGATSSAVTAETLGKLPAAQRTGRPRLTAAAATTSQQVVRARLGVRPALADS